MLGWRVGMAIAEPRGLAGLCMVRCGVGQVQTRQRLRVRKRPKNRDYDVEIRLYILGLRCVRPRRITVRSRGGKRIDATGGVVAVSRWGGGGDGRKARVVYLGEAGGRWVSNAASKVVVRYSRGRVMSMDRGGRGVVGDGKRRGHKCMGVCVATPKCPQPGRNDQRCPGPGNGKNGRRDGNRHELLIA